MNNYFARQLSKKPTEREIQAARVRTLEVFPYSLSGTGPSPGLSALASSIVTTTPYCKVLKTRGILRGGLSGTSFATGCSKRPLMCVIRPLPQGKCRFANARPERVSTLAHPHGVELDIASMARVTRI